jgi:hypothetical protein
MFVRSARPRRLGVASLATLAVATVVSLAGPTALTASAHADGATFTPAAPGTVFVSDVWNSQVVAVAPDGTKSTYVDGVQPYGLTLDAAGDLFIAQQNNDVVKIAPDGTRTDITFSTVSYALQVAVDGAGDVFVADPNNNQVVEMTAGGTESQVPISGLQYPEGLAVDGNNNLFVSDDGNGRIVKVDAGGTQSDFATGLSCPMGVTTDKDNNVFVADECANDVVKYTPDGTATNVGFQNASNPLVVAVDATGTVITAGQNNFFFASPGGGGAIVWQKDPNGPDSALTTIYTYYTYGIAVSQTRAPQAVSFASSPGSTPAVGDRYDVSANGGASGKPVLFTVDPASAGVCSVVSHLDSTGTVSLNGIGTCTLHAAQAGTRGYEPGQADQSFGVKANQGITFTSRAKWHRVGDTFRVTATGGQSGNPVVFSLASSTPHACTVSATGSVHFKHARQCTVVASQDGNGGYYAARVFKTLTVHRARQDVKLTETPGHHVAAHSSFRFKATGGESGYDVRIHVTGACTVTPSGKVSFRHDGICHVSAVQAGNGDYQAGRDRYRVVIGG